MTSEELRAPSAERSAERGSDQAELYCPICEQQFDDGELCPTDGNRLVRLTNQIDPFLGRELDGRFTILERIGAGGMGSVYRARQHSVNREIAIKVIHPGWVSDPSSIKRFLREARIASRLAHPNIVAVMDFGQAPDGVFWLAMELVEGRTLHDVLLADGPFEVARLVRVGLQLCDALEGAHAIPIVHRDLKPANIMVLASGRDLVKVLDFGLAKSLAIDATGNTMTSAGMPLGTPTFMPPELANGEACDGRADLYSLGCILFLLATGQPPFVTDSVPEMIALHGTQPAPPVTGVPSAIGAVIDRLLAKHPEDRFPTAAATRAALEAAYDESRASATALDDGHTHVYAPAPPRGPETSQLIAPPVPGVSTPPPRRRATLAIAAALGVAAVAIALAIGLAGSAPAAPPPAPPVIAPIATPAVELDAGAPAGTDAPVDAALLDAALLDAALDPLGAIELVDAGAQPAHHVAKPHRSPPPPPRKAPF